MIKNELIDELTAQTPDVSRRDMEIIVNAVFDTMVLSLAHHNRIEIRGFGSFIAKQRDARASRNPRTGKVVAVPKKWVPFFNVGKELRERINK